MAIQTQDLSFAHAVGDAIREVEPGAKVILFGSRARGDAASDSDWDFMVVLSHEPDYVCRRAIRDRVYEVQLEKEQVASLLYKSDREFAHYRHIGIPIVLSVLEEGQSI